MADIELKLIQCGQCEVPLSQSRQSDSILGVSNKYGLLAVCQMESVVLQPLESVGAEEDPVLSDEKSIELLHANAACQFCDDLDLLIVWTEKELFLYSSASLELKVKHAVRGIQEVFSVSTLIVICTAKEFLYVSKSLELQPLKGIDDKVVKWTVRIKQSILALMTVNNELKEYQITDGKCQLKEDYGEILQCFHVENIIQTANGYLLSYFQNDRELELKFGLYSTKELTFTEIGEDLYWAHPDLTNPMESHVQSLCLNEDVSLLFCGFTGSNDVPVILNDLHSGELKLIDLDETARIEMPVTDEVIDVSCLAVAVLLPPKGDGNLEWSEEELEDVEIVSWRKLPIVYVLTETNVLLAYKVVCQNTDMTLPDAGDHYAKSQYKIQKSAASSGVTQVQNSEFVKVVVNGPVEFIEPINYTAVMIKNGLSSLKSQLDQSLKNTEEVCSQDFKKRLSDQDKDCQRRLQYQKQLQDEIQQYEDPLQSLKEEMILCQLRVDYIEQQLKHSVAQNRFTKFAHEISLSPEQSSIHDKVLKEVEDVKTKIEQLKSVLSLIKSQKLELNDDDDDDDDDDESYEKENAQNGNESTQVILQTIKSLSVSAAAKTDAISKLQSQIDTCMKGLNLEDKDLKLPSNLLDVDQQESTSGSKPKADFSRLRKQAQCGEFQPSEINFDHLQPVQSLQNIRCRLELLRKLREKPVFAKVAEVENDRKSDKVDRAVASKHLPSFVPSFDQSKQLPPLSNVDSQKASVKEEDSIAASPVKPVAQSLFSAFGSSTKSSDFAKEVAASPSPLPAVKSPFSFFGSKQKEEQQQHPAVPDKPLFSFGQSFAQAEKPKVSNTPSLFSFGSSTSALQSPTKKEDIKLNAPEVASSEENGDTDEDESRDSEKSEISSEVGQDVDSKGEEVQGADKPQSESEQETLTQAVESTAAQEQDAQQISSSKEGEVPQVQDEQPEQQTFSFGGFQESMDADGSQNADENVNESVVVDSIEVTPSKNEQAVAQDDDNLMSDAEEPQQVATFQANQSPVNFGASTFNQSFGTPFQTPQKPSAFAFGTEQQSQSQNNTTATTAFAITPFGDSQQQQKTSQVGAPPFGTPAFGQSPFQTPASPPFGQSAFSTSGFGQPSFATQQSQQLNQQQSSFGQTAFSQMASNLPKFGSVASPQQNVGVFGQSAFSTAGGGNNSQTQQTGGFGGFSTQQTSTGQGGGSIFGAAAQSKPSIFGNTQSTSSSLSTSNMPSSWTAHRG
ncbi:hypothetical protein MIR68_012124 [Amoeboaphelidium protococcarum]|nr:hypothetical protein MIR68_012124 [Amoeboaphelidium protococcarum]